MDSFDCSKCGKCCIHIHLLFERLPQLAKLIGEDNAAFPYSHSNGICEKLNLDNNLCSVYENRPVICNIDKLIEIIAEKTEQDLSLLRKPMYTTFKKICVKLQQKEM